MWVTCIRWLACINDRDLPYSVSISRKSLNAPFQAPEKCLTTHSLFDREAHTIVRPAVETNSDRTSWTSQSSLETL